MKMILNKHRHVLWCLLLSSIFACAMNKQSPRKPNTGIIIRRQDISCFLNMLESGNTDGYVHNDPKRDLMYRISINSNTKNDTSTQKEQELHEKLMQAIKDGNLANVIDCIKDGALIDGLGYNEKTTSSQVPLLLTTYSHFVYNDFSDKRKKIIHYLIGHNADIFKTNDVGNSAFSCMLNMLENYSTYLVLMHAQKKMLSNNPIEVKKTKENVFLTLRSALSYFDKNYESKLKTILYVFRDFTTEGFFRCKGIKKIVDSHKGIYETKVYFLPEKLPNSLKKYFIITPLDIIKYERDPQSYKKQNPDEFDPVKKYPKDFEDTQNEVKQNFSKIEEDYKKLNISNLL